mgnify:CR=1 FL=1
MTTVTKYKSLPVELVKQLREVGNNTCSICGCSPKKALVHHKDTNHFNQDSDNLQLVCSSCHVKLHRRIAQQYESPLETRTILVFIRLTPEEKTLLVEQSKLAGISMSALVRLMLSQYSKKELGFS